MLFQALLAGLLFVGLIVLLYALMSREGANAAEVQRNASLTRTAVALTSQALLGPFPTSTAPTQTASETPSPTSTPTRTPTRTVTSTETPIPIITFTARTNMPHATFMNTPRPPTSTPRPTQTRTPRPRPTSTRVPPTIPPTTYP